MKNYEINNFSIVELSTKYIVNEWKNMKISIDRLYYLACTVKELFCIESASWSESTISKRNLERHEVLLIITGIFEKNWEIEEFSLIIFW